MRFDIKAFGLEDLDNRVESTFFKHDGAQYCFFQVFRLGWHLAIYHGAEIKGGFSSCFTVFINISKIHYRVSIKEIIYLFNTAIAVPVDRLDFKKPERFYG